MGMTTDINMEIIKALGMVGDAGKMITALDIHLEALKLPVVTLQRVILEGQSITPVLETFELTPRGDNARLLGEGQVLRGLLSQALSVMETITDESAGDDWMMLTALKDKIAAVLLPAATEVLL